MLCDSDGDCIEDVRGLPTYDCLKWLVERAGRRLCGFYLMYDWTMILQDLPNRDIYRLFRPELRKLGTQFSRIKWRGFRLHWLKGTLQISRGKQSVTVYDVGSYYQCSFVEACRKAGIGEKYLDFIEQMKDERGSRAWGDNLDRMKRYCFEECRMLRQLVDRLEQSHEVVGLQPRSWHGPGATASAVLTQHRIHEARGFIPQAVEDIALRAYFGGRFEHSCIGRKENVYAYDLVSAYPAQTFELPCLEHGRWKKVSAERALEAPIGAIRVRVGDVCARNWAPLPCRLSDGRIVYPRGGFEGWYWRSEVVAALDGWPHGIELLQGWVCERTCDCQPFAFVKELFETRKAGSVEEKQVYKLVINSLYGKLAQRIGRPKFASTVWAGLITAGTRARLLSLMAHHHDISNVYAVATDGLYSSEQIHVSNDGELGTWKRERHGAMWFVRPGIYWAEEDDTIRARGLGRKKLAESRELIQAAIERGDVRVDLGTATAFGGARETVYLTPRGRLKRSCLFGEWHDLPCKMSFDPKPKRNPDWSLVTLDGVQSKPYGGESDDGESPQVLELVSRLLEARQT